MLKPLTRAFTDHPASVGESYGAHLVFAGGFGLRLILAGLAAVLHGLLPFAFERTASRIVIGMSDGLRQRTAVSEAVQAKPEAVVAAE